MAKGNSQKKLYANDSGLNFEAQLWAAAGGSDIAVYRQDKSGAGSADLDFPKKPAG